MRIVILIIIFVASVLKIGVPFLKNYPINDDELGTNNTPIKDEQSYIPPDEIKEEDQSVENFLLMRNNLKKYAF